MGLRILVSFAATPVLAWALVPLPMLAQEADAQGFAAPLRITREEVERVAADRLRALGLPDQQLRQAENLDLPVAVPATEGHTLQISSMCWEERSQRLQFRLRCGQRGECLPFLAYVPRAAQAADGRGAVPFCHVRSRKATTEREPQLETRSGQRGLASKVSAGMQMSASVICLERGHIGDVIRARTLDGHILHARVLALSPGGGVALELP